MGNVRANVKFIAVVADIPQFREWFRTVSMDEMDPVRCIGKCGDRLYLRVGASRDIRGRIWNDAILVSPELKPLYHLILEDMHRRGIDLGGGAD